MWGSVQRSESLDFTDIVHQREQPPLYVHFRFRTKRESVQALVDTEVGKDRLNNAQSSGIDSLALLAVDLGFHKINQVRLTRVDLNRKIPARSIRLAQTARLQRIGSAVFRAGVVDIIGAVTVALVARVAGQFFSLRTEIDLLAFIIRKIIGGEETGLGVRSLPVVDAILETLVLGKARIAFAELDIGNVGVSLFIFANRQTIE